MDRCKVQEHDPTHDRVDRRAPSHLRLVYEPHNQIILSDAVDERDLSKVATGIVTTHRLLGPLVAMLFQLLEAFFDDWLEMHSCATKRSLSEVEEG